LDWVDTTVQTYNVMLVTPVDHTKHVQIQNTSLHYLWTALWQIYYSRDLHNYCISEKF